MSQPNRSMNLSTPGRRLRRHFERKHTDTSPFEGVPAYLSYQCSAGHWTMGEGCTTYIDDDGVEQPVGAHQTFTHEEVRRTEAFHEQKATDIIREFVTVPLQQHEFDALHSAVWVFKRKLFRRSDGSETDTAKAINSGNRDDAVRMLLLWKNERRNGQLVPSLGAYRRRCAEALLFKGLPWEDATAYGTIELDTPFFDVIETRARNNQSEEQLTIPRRGAEPEAAKPEERVQEVEQAPPSAEFDPRVSEPVRQPEAPRRAPISPNTRPLDAEDGIDPEAGTKPFNESREVQGWAAKIAAIWTGALGAIPAAAQLATDGFWDAVRPLAPWVFGFFGIMVFLSVMIYVFGGRLERIGRTEATQYLRRG